MFYAWKLKAGLQKNTNSQGNNFMRKPIIGISCNYDYADIFKNTNDIGLQWHPEKMYGNEEQKKIFAAFIESATRYS